MKLILDLINKNQQIIDADDVIAICPCINSDGLELPRLFQAIMEVYTATITLQCTNVTFGYGQAIAGKSVNQTKKWQQELHEAAWPNLTTKEKRNERK